MTRTAIVGAGAAGLSLALMLDGDITIYEKEKEVGGLCRSSRGEVTFDKFGPHILGGIPEAVDWIVKSTGIDFVEGETNNVGWVDGEFVKHPFENEALGRQYMTKMWKADPDVLKLPALNAQAGRKPGGVPKFRYPKHGGYQAIIDAWEKQLFNQIVYSIPCYLSQAGSFLRDYDNVVWCAPVPGLHYNTLTTVTLRYAGRRPPYTAIYLPEDDTPFHRVSFPSVFAPDNSPPGEFTMQGEISGTSSSDVARGYGLAHLGDLWGFGDPIPGSCQTFESKYAYPLPDGTKAYFPGIHFHGRSGGHQYLNLDGVVAASMKLAAELNNGYR